MRRLAITVQGVVQGVGFRPFVYRVARERGLVGWVRNGTDGVRIEAQGEDAALAGLLDDLRHRAPPQAIVREVRQEELPLGDDAAMRILESREDAAVQASIPADLATCADCLAEMAAAGERRHRYPFTNCTQCGPRYTIIEGLPYDRPRTSMKGFPLCDDCAREYHDPLDRRFHAQPVACPRCGPRLTLLDVEGGRIAEGETALDGAAAALVEGRVVALKGVGGFQLLVDATSDEAVALLRRRKRREEKPFALMLPSLDVARSLCLLDADEEAALTSPQAPILLLRRRASVGTVAAGVAPGNPRLGVMLPYTPLHRLLLDAVARPLVCTSGNLSDEPMCVGDDEAVRRLGGIADRFLVHDRPVVRPVDDSVARRGPTGIEILRRARGHAPLPLPLHGGAATILALGGQLKGAIALRTGGQALVSQHLGDLDSLEGAALLERTVRDLLGFLRARPDLVVCDEHPDYSSTRLGERLAAEWGVPLARVQHHHAHVAACLAEHEVVADEEVLGLAWDGTGHGADGTVWGGEALLCRGAGYRRLLRLRPLPLLGGERAIREPRRAALAVLLGALGEEQASALAAPWFSDGELRALLTLAASGAATPTSSMGRLFDAVACLCGLRERNAFEGQAAMALEWVGEGAPGEPAYPLPLDGDEADWRPLVGAIVEDRRRGLPVAAISARFHHALADLAVAAATRAARPRVALSGGCFQNLTLSSLARARLEAAGFAVLSHRLVPPNDGGIALGQLRVAALGAVSA